MRKYLIKLPRYTKATKEIIAREIRTKKEVFIDYLIDKLKQWRGGDTK